MVLNEMATDCLSIDIQFDADTNSESNRIQSTIQLDGVDHSSHFEDLCSFECFKMNSKGFCKIIELFESKCSRS